MLLWYVGVSVLLVANVFKSSGIDYRLIALGSMLPLLVDLPVGHTAFGHTVLFPIVLLVVVMIGTIGRPRLTRRRLLCLPIGVFCGLILSGAFTNADLFWWPLGGTKFPDDSLLPVWWVVRVTTRLTRLSLIVVVPSPTWSKFCGVTVPMPTQP